VQKKKRFWKEEHSQEKKSCEKGGVSVGSQFNLRYYWAELDWRKFGMEKKNLYEPARELCWAVFGGLPFHHQGRLEHSPGNDFQYGRALGKDAWKKEHAQSRGGLFRGEGGNGGIGRGKRTGTSCADTTGLHSLFGLFSVHAI